MPGACRDPSSRCARGWLLTGTTTAGEAVRVRGCGLFDLPPDGRIRRKDSYWEIVGCPPG
ncbi:hypothetical protein D0Z06_10360 [Geodermatophilus marinus]|nr:hypothetical protein D0Z06_10360 [Geodermatophilus sp. LHW52908]